MKQEIKQQFDEMKAKHPDTLLLFSIGDFFESYEEDAVVLADVLGIILTVRNGEKVAAFPSHALDEYLPRLVRSGKRVAICDQLEDPKVTKKLVKRGITESATKSQTSKSSTKMNEVMLFPTREIKPSPMNPRKTFDEEAIKELAASIKQYGLYQPITVRPKDGMYEIVMGERRYRAFLYNQETCDGFPQEIPCLLREMSDEEALDAMITENLQREDVDPIEEAFAFGQLLKTGKSIEEIADRFGKSKRFIQERIKLDNLLPELKAYVTKEWMTIGAAMHLSKLTEDEQRKFLEDFAEEYDANTIENDGPITKRDAQEFTNDLFMTIKRANWPNTFAGSCGTTCDKCPFNNANVGCLFYEMKPHEATCTNRERWNAKHYSWLLQIIKDNADVLVKDGDDLESGKTVVVAEPNQFYIDRNPEYEPLLKEIRDMGFKVVKKEDYFERFSSYREDDERLKDKLAANEVYRTISVETGWRGTEVHVRYYAFKKEDGASEESSDEVQAMNLVNQYKENERKNASALATKLRDVLSDMNPEELSKQPLSQTESLILMTLILRKCSYKFRNARYPVSTYSPEPKALNYAREHTTDVFQICRDYIREVLSSSGVEYDIDLQDCQYMLLQEWANEAAEEIRTDMTLKLAKKQSKIQDKLTALGYNTDGSKMAF